MSESEEEQEENLIDVIRTKKYFPIRAGLLKRVVGHVRAVDDVSFYIKKGETLGLVGESGCGKTTVGRSIMMLTPPTEGHVFYEAPREVVEGVSRLASNCQMKDDDLRTPEKSLELVESLKSLTGIQTCYFKENDKEDFCRSADRLRDEILSNESLRKKLHIENMTSDKSLFGKTRALTILLTLLNLIGIALIIVFYGTDMLSASAEHFVMSQAFVILMLVIGGLMLLLIYLQNRSMRILYAEEIAEKKTLKKIDKLRKLANDAIDLVAKRYCINHMRKRDVRRMRSQIQFVFQDPFSSLNPRMLIKDIVSEPMRVQMRLKKRTPEESRAMIARLLIESMLLINVASIILICYSIFSLMQAELIADESSQSVILAMMFAFSIFLFIAGFILPRVLGSVPIREILGERTRRSELIRKKTIDLLEKVGLNVEHMYRFPHEFSGGQRQRIGIARALSVNPEFIVLDEPTSALDVSVQAQVLNMLNDLQDDFGLTYLFISHDLSTIRYMCDRVAVMYLGKIVEYAPKKELFGKPIHPYTEALLSVIPVPDPDQKRDRIILTGDVPSPANPPPGCRFHTRCPVAIEKCKIEEPPLIDRGNEHFVACHVR